MGETFAPALGGFAASPVVGPLEVVFFGTGGFFLGYLWTRLRLGPLLAASDEEMRAAEQRLSRRAVAAVTELRNVPGPAPESAAAAAPEQQQPPPREVLWVDDQPSGNAWEIDQLQQQNIRVTTKLSTEEALAELSANPGRYGVVITDMGRYGDRRAGYTLLKAMRDHGIQTPVVIYAGPGAGSAERNAEARDRGAMGSTESPIRLFEMVGRALQTQAPTGPERKPGT